MKYRVALFFTAMLCTAVLFAEKPIDWNESEAIAEILTTEGEKAGLPVGLAHCVAYTESRFNPHALSSVVDGFRSCGLMQLYRKYLYVPGGFVERYSTAVHFQWENPEHSAEVGCGYLAYLIKRFGGSVYLGVLAYNWGPTNVQNMTAWSDVPPECRKYADDIMKLLDEYQEDWR